MPFYGLSTVWKIQRNIKHRACPQGYYVLENKSKLNNHKISMISSRSELYRHVPQEFRRERDHYAPEWTGIILWKLNDSLESEKDLGKYRSRNKLLLYLLLPTGRRVNTDYKVKIITQVSMA